MAAVLQPVVNISSLPENLLLHVFSYLPIKDLCTISRVCRVWRRVARDNSLWRHVNLQPYKLNLQRMWKVIRAHFSDILLSLRLRGYMDPAGVSWNRKSLSDAMLKDLQERCPNITTLDLTTFNLSSVALENFPNQLVELCLTRSLIPSGWFRHMAEDGAFPKLVHVDLSGSSKTTDGDLKDLTASTHLKVLRINGAYRVTERGLRTVADAQKGLEVLAVAETQCTDLAMQYLGSALGTLRELDLSRCSKVTDEGVAIAAACLKKLECLNLSGCGALTNRCLDSLNEMKTLTCVNLTDTTLVQAARSKLADRQRCDQSDCLILRQCHD